LVLAQRHAALQHLGRFRGHVKGNFVAVHNGLRADFHGWRGQNERGGRPATPCNTELRRIR
jgi:hypothetical protein